MDLAGAQVVRVPLCAAMRTTGAGGYPVALKLRVASSSQVTPRAKGCFAGATTPWTVMRQESHD